MIQEETKADSIEGLAYELDENRSVFVGQVPGKSDVYILFTNAGVETRVKCSYEAAEVLYDLLARTSLRGLMASSTWTFVAEKPSCEAALAV